MRKRRSDSPWSKLTVEQRKLMDKWYFDENLSYPQILERTEKEFGIKTSKQTLTGYFRHRHEVVNGSAPWEDAGEDDPLARRVGAGMSWSDLQARVMQSASMAAYELSLAEPDKMRVKEIRSLMKMFNEHQRLVLDRKAAAERSESQAMLMSLKVLQFQEGKQTKEEFEQMCMEAADILYRGQRKGAEHRAAMAAEMFKTGVANDDNTPKPAENGAEGGQT